MRIFKFITIVFLSVFLINITSYADEYDYKSDNEYYNYKEFDDNDLVTKGSIVKEEYSNNVLLRTKEKYTGTGLYIKKKVKSSRVYYYLYGKNSGQYIRSWFRYNTSDLEDATSSGTVDGNWSNDYTITYDEHISNDKYNQLVGTNIPIFDADDANYDNNVNKYLNDGDMSGAENYMDVRKNLEHDDNIELPQNLRIASGYDYNFLIRNNLILPTKDLVLTWDQTVDTSDYKYEIEICYKLDHVTDTNIFGKETFQPFTSNYCNIGNAAYGGNKDITYTVDQNIQCDRLIDIQHKNDWTGKKTYIRNIYIRVRNVVGTNSSNWVVVSLDIPNKSANATVQDDDGNAVQDDNYNNYDAINGDQVDSENVGSLSDFKKITDFIKNGFGLLGSGGLVGLLSSFFGNIFPQSFWNIITIGMAVVILVGIINFLLKR